MAWYRAFWTLWYRVFKNSMSQIRIDIDNSLFFLCLWLHELQEFMKNGTVDAISSSGSMHSCVLLWYSLRLRVLKKFNSIIVYLFIYSCTNLLIRLVYLHSFFLDFLYICGCIAKCSLIGPNCIFKNQLRLFWHTIEHIGFWPRDYG